MLNDDGEVARIEDLADFAELHSFKVGTIGELIAYRMRHDRLVERTSERSFVHQNGGEWRSLTFRNKTDDESRLAQKRISYRCSRTYWGRTSLAIRCYNAQWRSSRASAFVSGARCVSPTDVVALGAIWFARHSSPAALNSFAAEQLLSSVAWNRDNKELRNVLLEE